MAKMSRRNFLKTAAVTSLGLAASTKLSAPYIAKAQDCKEITAVFHFGTGAYWDTRLNMFREQHPEIELTVINTLSDDEFVQKVSTMVAGGTPPDLVKLSGGRMLATAPTGIYEDLRPRIEASETMSQIWELLPGQGRELTYCGQQIGVPVDIDFRVWVYNKDIFDAAGLDYPTMDWTWENMIEWGKVITKPDDNIWFAALPVHSFQDASEWFWQAGGSLFGDDCGSVNLSEAPNLEAMRFLVSLFKEHEIAPPPALGLGDIGISFETGNMAMASVNSPTMSAELSNAATWGFNWGSVFAPTGPATADGYVKSNGWAIPKDASNADCAWQLIEWWHSDETATAFAEMGELVPRSDIRDSVSLVLLPEQHQDTVARAGTHGRGLERCPAWSAAQRQWRQELDTAISGNTSVEDAMMTADEKAEEALAEIMADSCQ